ncbi:SDR family oxidoreductase [Novosphingobium guangzhouense]|uniref:NAD(P)-dependent oxidoreductase n=1 Tax=Novosphingobium guangzhouense TaxID=1850347 RepID=A0A2K2FTW7_9SPHN|nr:SDR family oxidoreductase [Novosphingobium guangzhouense]PNU02229.1 NAD(P)-dependent oxidoreductase [Novosphingobium guangzhouense]
MRLAGKRAVVTAAAAGIGRAIAERFVAEGATVHAVDRNADELVTLAGVTGHIADLTASDAATMLAEATGRADILVNCAGIVYPGTLLDCTEDQWATSLDLNATAMFRLIKAYLPTMVERRAGSIVNVSSVASSIIGVRNRFAYGASKAAVIGLTKSVAVDFVADGVRCNAICPGTVDSPSLRVRMQAQAEAAGESFEATHAAFSGRQPLGRLGQPNEIAALALYLASDESAFTTGTTAVIDGGWTVE